MLTTYCELKAIGCNYIKDAIVSFPS